MLFPILGNGNEAKDDEECICSRICSKKELRNKRVVQVYLKQQTLIRKIKMREEVHVHLLFLEETRDCLKQQSLCCSNTVTHFPSLTELLS